MSPCTLYEVNMNEVKSFINRHNLVCYAVVIAICVGLCWAVGHRNRVYDNGITTDTVRQQIGAASSQQHEISAGIEDAQNTASGIKTGVERSEAAVDRAASTADDIERTIEDQRAIIRECQSILGDVRRTGKKTAADN